MQMLDHVMIWKYGYLVLGGGRVALDFAILRRLQRRLQRRLLRFSVICSKSAVVCRERTLRG